MQNSDRRTKTMPRIALLLALGGCISAALGTIVGAGDQFIRVRMSQISYTDLWKREFYRRVENSFKNHFIVRSQLVAVKHWIDRNIFSTAPATDVHVGAEGWMFFRPELRKGGCAPKTWRETQDLVRDLERLEKTIEASGRQFVFLVAPNKATIYPEYLNLPRQRLGCEKSRYDLLLEAFSQSRVRRFVRLDDLLQAKKGDRVLYLKTDNHWNYHGGMLASQALLRAVAPLLWEQAFPLVEMRTSRQVGNLARAMDSVETEEMPVAEAITYRTAGPVFPRVVIYGDSFMAIPMEVLGGVFVKMDFVDFRLKAVHESVDALRAAGIVVLEIWEMELQTLSFYVRTIQSVFDHDPVLQRDVIVQEHRGKVPPGSIPQESQMLGRSSVAVSFSQSLK